MKRLRALLVPGLLLASIVMPIINQNSVSAIGLAGETFTGISTVANAWTSGGTGGSVACLTAATVSATDSVPSCSGGPLDAVGSGVLRLTPASGGRSGFVIYNTPVSAGDGLNIEFNMHQYGGSGADGISFFLIDGSASPTVPGAPGGSLGYASSGATAGLVGGYVGIGFDRYGNYTSSSVGGGGPGAAANSIGIRGSQSTTYGYVTHTAANSSLSGTTRANSHRRVKINISTGNIMSVLVDYNGGNGYETELSGIDLNTINGVGSLPSTFKFGFAASTGGSTNNHEISGLNVETNPPSVSVVASHTGNFTQGTTGSFNLAVTNGGSAEATTGDITVTQTLPTGFTPTTATGTGWSCNVAAQIVTCVRPGDGANALTPGSSAPNITVTVNVSNSATTPLVTTATVITIENVSENDEDTDSVVVLAGSYLDNDGVFNVVEEDAPNGGDGNNDGTIDSQQDSVTSLPNPVTGNYAVLQTSGCTGTNNSVSLVAESANAKIDGNYVYPAGLMSFAINCLNPGDTSTVVHYYYGNYNASDIVMRKYNSNTQTYTTIADAIITNVIVGSQQALRVEYQVTDGGALDEDGLIDGIITDPAGPAILGASTSGSPLVPNTGLQNQSMMLYTISGLVGIIVLTHEITASNRKHRRNIKSASR